jgi:hypothetical protein
MSRAPFTGLCRAALLSAVAALAVAGCSIDRVEWESTGPVVEEARHALEEEHGAVDPVVECIQREVAGAVWECRAHAGADEYECEAKVDIHHEIYFLECEPTHEEQGEADHGSGTDE